MVDVLHDPFPPSDDSSIFGATRAVNDDDLTKSLAWRLVLGLEIAIVSNGRFERIQLYVAQLKTQSERLGLKQMAIFVTFPFDNMPNAVRQDEGGATESFNHRTGGAIWIKQRGDQARTVAETVKGDPTLDPIASRQRRALPRFLALGTGAP